MAQRISLVIIASLLLSISASAELESDLQGKSISDLFACAEEPENPLSIELSKNSLICAERKLIVSDFSYLKNLKLEKHDPELAKLLGIQAISADTLIQWLEEREHYLYNANRNNSEFRREDTGPIPLFSNPLLPFDDYVAASRATPGALAKKLGITGAANMGSGVFMQSKQEGYVYDFVNPEGKTSQVLTERIGVVSVEGAFTLTWYPNPEEPRAEVNSIFRLGILFHEARHSDGSGRHLGFSHDLCPDGSDYASEPSCDDTLNGAYTVGVHVMNELMLNCKTCTPEDIGALQIHMANQLIRVNKEIPVSSYAVEQAADKCSMFTEQLDPAAPAMDQESSDKLKTALVNCKANLEFVKNVRRAEWVDPTPETLTLSDKHNAPLVAPDVLLPDHLPDDSAAPKP